MRAALLALLAVLVGACSSTPEPEPFAPGVLVEVALVDGAVQPPVFRWDAPVAARVIVQRGRTTVWEIAEGDLVLLLAAGTGYTWAAACVRWGSAA